MKTLDQLIRIALLQNNRSIHHYYLFYSFACSAINDFNIDHVGSSRTVQITPGTSVSLGDTYAGVYDIGYLNSGHFISFERSDTVDVDMFRNAAQLDGSPYIHLKITEGTMVARSVESSFGRSDGFGIPFAEDGSAAVSQYMNIHGENTGGFYGASLDNKQYFKIDHTTGDVAVMASGYEGNVAARYMTSEEDITPATIIPKSGHNFVVAAIRHYHAERTRSVDRYEKMTSQQDFAIEYEKYQSRTTRLTPEQILQSITRSTTQTPKK